MIAEKPAPETAKAPRPNRKVDSSPGSTVLRPIRGVAGQYSENNGNKDGGDRGNSPALVRGRFTGEAIGEPVHVGGSAGELHGAVYVVRELLVFDDVTQTAGLGSQSAGCGRHHAGVLQALLDEQRDLALVEQRRIERRDLHHVQRGGPCGSRSRTCH